MINQGLNSGKKDLDRVWACSHFNTHESGKKQSRGYSGGEGKVSGSSVQWPPSFPVNEGDLKFNAPIQQGVRNP